MAAFVLASATFAQQRHTLTGDIRVHKSFASKILNNDRDIVVYLRWNYKANRKKLYSVLYLNDGQNLFDGATSFIPGQEWRVDETAQSLITGGQIESLIIVGGFNNPERRGKRVPHADNDKKTNGGKTRTSQPA